MCIQWLQEHTHTLYILCHFIYRVRARKLFFIRISGQVYRNVHHQCVYIYNTFTQYTIHTWNNLQRVFFVCCAHFSSTLVYIANIFAVTAYFMFSVGWAKMTGSNTNDFSWWNFGQTKLETKTRTTKKEEEVEEEQTPVTVEKENVLMIFFLVFSICCMCFKSGYCFCFVQFINECCFASTNNKWSPTSGRIYSSPAECEHYDTGINFHACHETKVCLIYCQEQNLSVFRWNWCIFHQDRHGTVRYGFHEFSHFFD